ncbi:MAG: hypothetical protein KAV82_00845 [Phycisphaerae bacterium]|nr:hypothetical protein [Phycisphaerae bacterium]
MVRKIILRIAGLTDEDTSIGLFAAGRRGLWPLAAPFLILTCDPRWEMFAAAACWSVLILPGLLAVNLSFSADHPFGRGFGKLGVASVGGLTLFGLVSWLACLLHWRLSGALALYAVLYAACVAVLCLRLVRRGPMTDVEDARPAVAGLLPNITKPAAAIILVGTLVMMAGVWLATLATLATQPPHKTRGLYGAHEYWWQGTLLGAVAAVIVASVIVFALRRAKPTEQKKSTGKGSIKGGAGGAKAARVRTSPSSWLAALLWLGVAVLTWHAMSAGYRMPPKPQDRLAHMAHRPPWNSDDVTYVAQAVDYRYGLPMGKHESSVGSDRPLNRADLSPLVAPLVATFSLVTGVECAALHHSVLPPLIILVGMSVLAAALMVVFRGHRWAVPLGMLVAAMLICKSWEYERSMVEFTVWRALQTKSAHLWLVHPLQLATLVLIALRPTKRHLFGGVAVAVVGHLAHPFATILGAVWSATICGAAVVWQRKALPKLVVLLACYGLLGGAFYKLSNAGKAQQRLSSGRVTGESEQSRDLVRFDGKPIPRQEPRILFGWNVLFCFGALATPVVLALGRRNREFLLVGLLGVVGVAVCNIAVFGKLVNIALPTSILWRARWMLPALICIAVVSFVLYWALLALLRRGDGSATVGRSFVACLAAGGMFAVLLANTSAYALRVGPLPKQLSKFSGDIHGLVDLLGGVDEAPFVWGPRVVTRELPQLMPNLKLVLSRRKIMLPADDDNFRQIVLGTRSAFYASANQLRGRTPSDAHLLQALQRLEHLYPIDHFVLDYGSGRGPQGARVLQSDGWHRVGNSGIYEVWRKLSTG